MRIAAMDGCDMELKPRTVDIPVSRPIGESRAGRDSQLDAACGPCSIRSTADVRARNNSYRFVTVNHCHRG
jgi:hypothetical protein